MIRACLCVIFAFDSSEIKISPNLTLTHNGESRKANKSVNLLLFARARHSFLLLLLLHSARFSSAKVISRIEKLKEEKKNRNNNRLGIHIRCDNTHIIIRLRDNFIFANYFHLFTNKYPTR